VVNIVQKQRKIHITNFFLVWKARVCVKVLRSSECVIKIMYMLLTVSLNFNTKQGNIRHIPSVGMKKRMESGHFFRQRHRQYNINRCDWKATLGKDNTSRNRMWESSAFLGYYLISKSCNNFDWKEGNIFNRTFNFTRKLKFILFFGVLRWLLQIHFFSLLITHFSLSHYLMLRTHCLEL
jgi:hypothetical protein